MINDIKNIVAVAIRELKKIIKDSNLLTVFIIAPLLYPALYGYIYFNKVESKIPIAILDYDQSSLSRSIIRDFDSHQNIAIKDHLINQAQVEEYVATQKVHAVVVIPKDFSLFIKTGKRTSIKLFISPGRMLVLSDIGIPISQIVNYFSGKISASLSEKSGIPAIRFKNSIQPLKLSFHNLFNPYLTYGDMILPALMIIILSQLVLIGVASSTAKEWALNKWHEQFQTSNKNINILLGKLLFNSFFFLILAIIIKLIWVNLFEIKYLGEQFELLIIVFFGILSITAFGLFIGTFFKHRISVFVILGFSSYPFFMLTGYAWSEPQLPIILKYLSYFIPMTPLVKSIFYYTQMGTEFNQIINWIYLAIIQTAFYSSLFLIRISKFKNLSYSLNIEKAS